MKNPKHKKSVRMLAAVLCLVLTAVPVFANNYPNTDREPPYDGSVLMVSSLQPVASDEDAVLLEDTGVPAPEGSLGVEPDMNAVYDGAAERSCGSMLHDRHSTVDFSGLLSETGLPKAPVSGEGYETGSTKEIYNDFYSGDGNTFTAEAVYIGDYCTIWQEAGAENPGLRYMATFFDGFVHLLSEEFGSPSSIDVDNDGKIAIVFAPMDAAQAYFSDADLFSPGDVSWASGNQMDMLHINTSLSLSDTIIRGFHELVHLVLFSRTFGAGDLWLEEVIAQNMLLATNMVNNRTLPEPNALIAAINQQGVSAPFIGDGNYVPPGSTPYGQWFLFACYLVNQTQFYSNGGSALFHTMLNAITYSENGYTASACTKEALVQTLTDIGYMGEDDREVRDFEELIYNYNTALFLRDTEEVYSLTNSGEADNVNGIILDKIIPFTDTVTRIPGGGAACWLESSGNVKPENQGTNIGYAGIYTEPIVSPETVESSVPSGEVTPGTEVALSCPTEGARIYYTTDEDNLAMEDGTLYTEPLTIESDTYLRAWAVITCGSQDVFGGGTTFRYQVSEPQGDSFEANDDFLSATSISFPGIYKATIHLAGDKDYYTFKLDHPASLNLTLTSPDGTSYSLALYRENGLPEKEELETSLLGEGTQCIRLRADAGTYYVAVSCPEGVACSDTESYTLDLQREFDTQEKLGALNLSEIHMLNAISDKENSPLAYDNALLTGGNFHKSVSYLSSWAGPVAEEKFPYPDMESQEEFKPLYEEGDSLCHVQNVLFLPKKDRENFIKHLKNAVYSYGAAEIYLLSAKNYQAENGTYWYVDRQNYEHRTYSDGGHIVAVVGWDDTIPKERFRGSGRKSTPLPQRDGAFIVRNSWGEDTGENGYFYLSYDDYFMSINNPAVYIADESPDNYNHQYLNDTKGSVASIYYPEQTSATVSEVFTLDNQEAPELLKAVSMQIASANFRYEFSVRIGDGEPRKVAEGTKKYAGYYTVRLDTPLLIPAGEKFEIILRIESSQEEPAFYVTANIKGHTSGVPAVSGKAFSYEGAEKPYDFGSRAMYPCIRAYTCDVDADGYRATSLEDNDSLSDTGTASGNKARASDAEEAANAADGLEEPLPEYITLTEVDAPDEGSPSRYGALAVNDFIDTQAEAPAVNLPEKFDLRETLTLTPVRDQGLLGSCWTFASIACVECSLASRDLNIVDYPSSLSLNSSSHTVVLDSEQREQAVSMSAELGGSKNPPSSKIFWSVTGDLDSIRVENTESFSGDEVQLFTALKPGTVTVTAQSDADMNVQASCKVTITGQGVESLELRPRKLEMKTGESSQLQAAVLPDTALDKTVLFESSQPDIVYVDQNGKVTALSQGTAVVTARAGNAEAFCEITVADSDSGKSDPGKSDPGKQDSSMPGSQKPDSQEPEKKPSKQGSQPSTKDDTPVLFMVLLLLGSAGLVIGLKRRTGR